MTFAEKLDSIIRTKGSLLCVGLDSALEKLPAICRSQSEPLLAFNKAIIDATAPYVAAFKVNTAFYEAYGSAGWRVLEETFRYLPADAIKIADAKRGDIGNTAQLYAKALFSGLNADVITASPLLGGDSVAPFLEDEERGVFFLCLTSNPGSRDFQHFSDGRVKLYEQIADRVASWNIRGNCGLVVGATHPEELRDIRRRAPDLPFLIPGIGAQGGDLEQSVRFGLTGRGGGALFNSSRAILFASSGDDFAAAAATAAERTMTELNEARKK